MFISTVGPAQASRAFPSLANALPLSQDGHGQVTGHRIKRQPFCYVQLFFLNISAEDRYTPIDNPNHFMSTPMEPETETDLLTTVELQKQVREELSLTLKTTTRLLFKELKRKDAEIRTLKKALRLFSTRRGSSSSSEAENDDSDTPMTLSGDVTAKYQLPVPVFDGDLLFCYECLFELDVDVDEEVCMCPKCGQEHDWETYEVRYANPSTALGLTRDIL